MPTTQLIVELSYRKDLAQAAEAAALSGGEEVAVPGPALTGVSVDDQFPPTQVPSQTEAEPSADPFDLSANLQISTTPEDATYIVRATTEDDPEKTCESLMKRRNVVGVYSDPVIKPTIVCPGSPPVGTDLDVEELLCVDRLHRLGADGSGVMVAIVDTGVNLDYLNSHGKSPTFDAARSWAPQPDLTPGELAVGHGTMCAFDACIAAPKCTLLDIALLQSTASGQTIMSGFLSDAVRAYGHLLQIMLEERRPGDSRSMVVNNSWGMFNPSWDFPPEHPGNYSDNPNHPFNRIVTSLEAAGADILFAAGNCGPDCPDSRCQNVTSNAIYGANGHPAVLCVAGVDTTKNRVGYSTVGPGRLEKRKPDISGYTHFKGSEVYAADGGTSAATPVVAGVVAAVRSKRPLDPNDASTSPAAIRSLMTSTAQDLGPSGYDYLHGYGVVDGCTLARRFEPIDLDPCAVFPWLCRPLPPDICEVAPWLCEEPVFDICRVVPDLCGPVPRHHPRPGDAGPAAGEQELEGVNVPEELARALRAYAAGAEDARRYDAIPHHGPVDGCDCGH